jgi:hypothetical protein
MTPGIKKKYLYFYLALALIFLVYLSINGYFGLGMLCDAYIDFFTALNSSFKQRLLVDIPYYNAPHFRPVYFLSIDVIYYISRFLNLEFDNFILIRIEMIIYYLSISYVIGIILLNISKNYLLALIGSAAFLIFPANQHNLFWIAGRLDLICSLFYLLSLLYLIKSIEEMNFDKKYYTASLLFFVLALSTKETAISFPPVAFLILLLLNKNDFNKSCFKILLPFFGLLFLYIFYRLIILNNNVIYLNKDNINAIFYLGLIIKSVISISIPMDYLSLYNAIRNNDFLIYVYLTILFISVALVAIKVIKAKRFNDSFIIISIYFLLILPFLVAGYLRPQMIMIPFAIMLIIITYYVYLHLQNTKEKKKAVLLLIFVSTFWLYSGYNIMDDWKTADKVFSRDIKNILETPIDLSQKNIVLCLPGRLKQSFILDYLQVTYFFWKEKEFKYNENIIDNINIGALDIVSLESKINFQKISDYDYELSVTGKTQYFINDNLAPNNIDTFYKEKDFKYMYSDLNFFKKPTKVKIILKNQNVNLYLFSENILNKIN